jgi:hypothetical protein
MLSALARAADNGFYLLTYHASTTKFYTYEQYGTGIVVASKSYAECILLAANYGRRDWLERFNRGDFRTTARIIYERDRPPNASKQAKEVPSR